MVRKPKHWVWLHCGGTHVVTEDEGNALNAAGRQNEDLCGYPVGADCLRRLPQLKPYVTRDDEPSQAGERKV